MHHTLVFHTIKLGKSIQKALGSKNLPHSLNVTQASAVMLIGQKGETSQSFLANHLHMEPASVVTLVDNLEKLKLVERQHTNDRRRYDICLTKRGKTAARVVYRRVKTLDAFIRSKLTAQEQKTLEIATDELVNAINVWKDPNQEQKLLSKGGET